MQSEENDPQQTDAVDRERSAEQLRSFMKLRRSVRSGSYERLAHDGNQLSDKPNVERTSTWRYPVKKAGGT